MDTVAPTEGEPKKKKKEQKKERSISKGKKDGREFAVETAARKAAMAAVTTAAEVQPAHVAKAKKEKRAKPEGDADELLKPKKKEKKEAGVSGEAVIVEGDIDSEGEEGGGEEAAKLTIEEAEARAGRTMHKDTREEADAAIAEGRRLYIANLPFSTSDAELRECFKGEITSIHWLTSKALGFRGTGFFTFSSAAEAEAGVLLSGSKLGGRTGRYLLYNRCLAI